MGSGGSGACYYGDATKCNHLVNLLLFPMYRSTVLSKHNGRNRLFRASLRTDVA